ncbi:MAG TPA: hypothetical protein VGH78_03145 [Solirubrobacteraceae bacterium]
MSELATSQPGPGAPGAYAGAQSTGGVQPPTPSADACPLCGAPVDAQQEWCLRCGAAARTRLAATPGWRWPIVAIVAVIALSLGVLAAALIDLAGGSGPTVTQVTRTVTTPAAAAPAPLTPTATPTTTAAAPTSTPPAATRTGTTTLKTTTTHRTTLVPRTTSKALPPASGGTGTGSIIPGVTQPGTSTPLSSGK